MGPHAAILWWSLSRGSGTEQAAQRELSIPENSLAGAQPHGFLFAEFCSANVLSALSRFALLQTVSPGTRDVVSNGGSCPHVTGVCGLGWGCRGGAEHGGERQLTQHVLVEQQQQGRQPVLW